MARRLIVSADDFGRSAAVNQAIEHAATCGVITSTSVLVNMPHAREAARLSSTCPTLAVGLHLNLTEGRPLLPSEAVRSLVDQNGNFLGWHCFLSRLWSGRLQKRHLEAETSAQIKRLQGIVGNITHVDSHQHIHIFPRVLHVLLKTATLLGIGRSRTNRRYFGASRGGEASQTRAALRHFLRRPWAVLGLALKTIQRGHVRRYGFRTPDYLLTPVPDIPPRPLELAAEAWARVFTQMPDGLSEILFHPGGFPGEAELLTCDDLRRAIERSCIELVSYAHL